MLCTYVQSLYRPIRRKVPEGVTVCYSLEVAVTILGTSKIPYMRELRLFAMYVRTEPVHTYIAKSLKRAICAILYNTKVMLGNLIRTKI